MNGQANILIAWATIFYSPVYFSGGRLKNAQASKIFSEADSLILALFSWGPRLTNHDFGFTARPQHQNKARNDWLSASLSPAHFLAKYFCLA